MNEDGKLSGFLLNRLRDLLERANGSLGEAYVLGDSPLVLLTSLQSGWESDPCSSRYISMPTPRITDQGLYEADSQSRLMRVYTHLDTRLMFADLYAKIARSDQRAKTVR